MLKSDKLTMAENIKKLKRLIVFANKIPVLIIAGCILNIIYKACFYR